MIHRKRTNGTIIRKLPEDGLYIQIYLYISAGFVMLAIVIMQAAPSGIPPHYFIRAAKPTDNTASTAMNFLLCYTDNFYYSLKTGTKVNVSLHILKKNQSKKKKRFVKIVYIHRTFTDKCNRNRLTTVIYTFNRQTATNTEKCVGHSIIAGRTSPIREKHPYDRTPMTVRGLPEGQVSHSKSTRITRQKGNSHKAKGHVQPNGLPHASMTHLP